MTKNTERGIEAGKEFAALTARGDVVLAEQVERRIDDIVGRWRDAKTFVWPVAVARVAGVPVVRLRRA